MTVPTPAHSETRAAPSGASSSLFYSVPLGRKGGGAGMSPLVGASPVKVGLTQRQMDVLRFVSGFIDASGGISPSFAQIGAARGIKSKGDIWSILTALERYGFIRRLFGKSSAIEILRPVSLPRIGTVPLYAVKVTEVHNPLNHTSTK